MSVYWKENPANLKKALDSVFSQTRQADEIVLVGDGPLPDGLCAVISDYQSHQEFHFVPLAQNMGLGLALKEGMSHCNNEWVARMDSDDICFPERFERQMGFLESHTGIDVLGCWTKEFVERDGQRYITATKRFPHTVADNLRFARHRCPVEHPAVVLRKSAVLQAGGYRHCPLFEDYDLWARMLVRDARFHNLQEPLLYFRMSADSFRRRGGLKYAMTEGKALLEFRRIGFVSWWQCLCDLCVRVPVRLMPCAIRAWIYKRLLRHE